MIWNGTKVKQLRIAMGLKQSEFSKLLSCKQSCLCKIEEGNLTTSNHEEALNNLLVNFRQDRIHHLMREIEFYDNFLRA